MDFISEDEEIDVEELDDDCINKEQNTKTCDLNEDENLEDLDTPKIFLSDKNYNPSYSIEHFNHNYIRKKYIDSRYDRMIELIQNPEKINKLIIYRFPSYIKRKIEGFIWGLAEGFVVGACIGGKWGGGGGWIQGGISQIFGFIFCPFVGGFASCLLGLISSKEEMSSLADDYLQAFASTAGLDTIKSRIETFPGYIVPEYLKNGDRLYPKT